MTTVLLAIAVSSLCVFAGVLHLYIKICSRCRRRVWRVGGSGQPLHAANEGVMSLLALQLQWCSIARDCDTMQNECFVAIYRAVWKTFCIHAALHCVKIHVILQDAAVTDDAATDAFTHLFVTR